MSEMVHKFDKNVIFTVSRKFMNREKLSDGIGGTLRHTLNTIVPG